MKLIEVNFKIASILIDCDDINTALKDVFSLVGNSIDADRIYYFNIYKKDDDKFYTSQKLEWVKGGVEPMIDNPDLQNIPLEVLDIFISPLLSNSPFEAIVNELEDSETKSLLQSQDIKSICVLPIFYNKAIQGFIGFDDCRNEKKWTDKEKSFLLSVVSNVSGVLHRIEIQNKLINESTERYNILGTINDGFFSLNDKFIVTYWNETAAMLFKVQKDDAIGKIIFDLKVCKVFINKLKKIVKNNTALHSFSYLRHFKEFNYWFEVTFSFHESSNTSSVIIKNITKNKIANIRLKNNYKKISEKNKLLKDIAQFQSHQVRAPLARIMALSDCIITDNYPSEDKKYILESLNKSANEIDLILHQIVSTTKNN